MYNIHTARTAMVCSHELEHELLSIDAEIDTRTERKRQLASAWNRGHMG